MMSLNKQNNQEVFSPSQSRINTLVKLKEEKEQGIYSGIPLWEHFPTLGNIIPSLDKGQVIINAAGSGVGKSMLTRFKDVIVPWLFIKKHPELNIDLKFVIFLLEDDEDRFKDYIISMLLYIKFKIEISPKRLKSSFKEPLSQDIVNKIKSIQNGIDDLLNRCTIVDSIYNSYGIYKYCRMKSEEWGIHYYTNLLGEDKQTITKDIYNDLPKLSEEYKDRSIIELKEKFKINILKYKDGWKYSHYSYNNPKQHVIAIFDNINCLNPDKTEGDLKTAMDKFMYQYVRTNIAKHWGWTAIAVQQNVGSAEEQAFDYRGNNITHKIVPSLDKFGDSKLTQRAAHLIYGLFDPQRFSIDEFMGYDITRLKKSSRFLFILKNNDGETNVVIPLVFRGEAGFFEELPPLNLMTIEKYQQLKL